LAHRTVQNKLRALLAAAGALVMVLVLYHQARCELRATRLLRESAARVLLCDAAVLHTHPIDASNKSNGSASLPVVRWLRAKP